VLIPALAIPGIANKIKREIMRRLRKMDPPLDLYKSRAKWNKWLKPKTLKNIVTFKSQNK
jgi:hypothetical protein